MNPAECDSETVVEYDCHAIPVPLVNPFSVIVDSREQAGYSFRGFNTDASARGGRRPLIIPTRVAGLETGDYSIEGYESRIAIERKSLDDLYGTLGYGRQRFERELERLAEMECAAVVIEASWPQILGTPPEHSRLSPKTVFRSVNAWEVKYPGIHWHAMGTKLLAEHKTFRLLERWWSTVAKTESRQSREQAAGNHRDAGSVSR